MIVEQLARMKHIGCKFHSIHNITWTRRKHQCALSLQYGIQGFG